MSQRIPYVLGGVAGAAILAKFVDQQVSEIPEKYPFIQLGLDAAGIGSNAKVSWYKTVHYDPLNRVGYATLSVDGHKVRICGRQKHSPAILSNGDSQYDELAGSGLVFYWENPWEIKASVLGFFSFLSRKFFPESQTSESLPEWELTFVAVDQEPLLLSTSLLAHPDFASEFFKNSEDRFRAKMVLGALFFSACFLGSQRAWKTWRMWPSYSYAQSFVLNHPSVKKFYEGVSPNIISRTGSFEAKKIDAELILRGAEVESVVKLIASQSTNGWIVNSATLVPHGCKPIDLLIRPPPTM